MRRRTRSVRYTGSATKWLQARYSDLLVVSVVVSIVVSKVVNKTSRCSGLLVVSVVVSVIVGIFGSKRVSIYSQRSDHMVSTVSTVVAHGG